jgi:hypothetical protein
VEAAQATFGTSQFTLVRILFMARHPGEHTSLKIVLEVAQDLLDKGYCLYLKNWYTSLKLDNLYTRKTDVVGTMRTNRKEFPDFMKKARLQKGETVAANCKKQMIMKSKEKRDVVLISTFHDGSIEDVTIRQGVSRNKEGGVNRNDDQLQSYKLA